MKGLDNATYLLMYIISNAVALVLLRMCWKHPNMGRVMLFLLFAWAGLTNWRISTQSPQLYLQYADLSFSNVYKQVINGWFSRHITEAVGSIATCQLLIAVSMLLRGWLFKAGSIGAIIFLLAIVPLGVGSGFPCTLIIAVSIFILLKKHETNFIWKWKMVSKPGKIKIADT